MKRSAVIFVMGLMAAAAAHAQSLELATLLGRPDSSQAFVSRTLAKSVALTSGQPELDFTTEMFSVLYRNGAPRTAAIEILESTGAITEQAWEQGIWAATLEAPVVLNVVGNSDMGSICVRMAEYVETAFVFVAGNDARRILPDSDEALHCSSGNILRVAPLNVATLQIPEFTNVGASVRLAAPGVNIAVTGPGGRVGRRSNGSVAAALVAARLAVLARENPTLRGARLIERFFEEETTLIPALQEKVESGRAWLGLRAHVL